MQQFQTQIDVVGNNIANSNTTGYKSARVDFADSFSQTLQASSAGSASLSGTPSMQIGTGVSTQSISNDFNSGALSRTGVQTDLAITSSQGFFVVNDPVNGIQYVTRAGDFRTDQYGHLITNEGMRVQGFNDNALATIGDIMIDGTSRPVGISTTATVTGYKIDQEGKINIKLSDGSEYVRGQILLQNFSDPQALQKEGQNLWSGIGSAGPLGGSASPTPAPPGTNGLGKIESGALELSNVNLANEFSQLIVSQRAFQASARMITTSDEILQELVNLKR